jgi:hypothetical protein
MGRKETRELVLKPVGEGTRQVDTALALSLADLYAPQFDQDVICT